MLCVHVCYTFEKESQKANTALVRQESYSFSLAWYPRLPAFLSSALNQHKQKDRLIFMFFSPLKQTKQNPTTTPVQTFYRAQQMSKTADKTGKC